MEIYFYPLFHWDYFWNFRRAMSYQQYVCHIGLRLWRKITFYFHFASVICWIDISLFNPGKVHQNCHIFTNDLLNFIGFLCFLEFLDPFHRAPPIKPKIVQTNTRSFFLAPEKVSYLRKLFIFQALSIGTCFFLSKLTCQHIFNEFSTWGYSSKDILRTVYNRST